jgi:SDR family mycofactocin-dependent oxidoreductase
MQAIVRIPGRTLGWLEENQMSQQRFEGKVALITGAARGQGRAEAVRLAEEGADIIALDICEALPTVDYTGATPDDLEETERLVKALGRQVVARRVDTRDMAALQAAVDEAVAELGRLDVVVANAGICSYGLLWEISEEKFRTMMDVNIIGTWHTLKATVPFMIQQGTGGAIVVTSSVGGLRGMPWLGHYVASKHAVTGMAKTLANELGQYNIRVISLHPNAVDTAMGTDQTLYATVRDNPALGAIFMNALPATLTEPENVAAAVAFVTSDDGRYMTGSELIIDLGNLAR